MERNRSSSSLDSADQFLKITKADGHKSMVDTYILTIVLGLTGAHHFYLGRPWFLMAYFMTFGLLGIGWILDIYRVPWLVKEANARIGDPKLRNKKYLCDAYILWFPFGLFGFHLFYLRRPLLGILYFFTAGLFGLGWIVDAFMIPSMVREANENLNDAVERKIKPYLVYFFIYSPLGLFGAHYYYLRKPWWGILYTLSFGLFGIGWVVDWFRGYWLIQRSKLVRSEMQHPETKYLDDAYLLWFPFGILGLPHFYFGRHGWGLLYFTTFGLVGIGWLVDLFRLPTFVREYNIKINSQHLNEDLEDGKNDYQETREVMPRNCFDSGYYGSIQSGQQECDPPTYQEAISTK